MGTNLRDMKMGQTWGANEGLIFHEQEINHEGLVGNDDHFVVPNRTKHDVSDRTPVSAPHS